MFMTAQLSHVDKMQLWYIAQDLHMMFLINYVIRELLWNSYDLNGSLKGTNLFEHCIQMWHWHIVTLMALACHCGRSGYLNDPLRIIIGKNEDFHWNSFKYNEHATMFSLIMTFLVRFQVAIFSFQATLFLLLFEYMESNSPSSAKAQLE